MELRVQAQSSWLVLSTHGRSVTWRDYSRGSTPFGKIDEALRPPYNLTTLVVFSGRFAGREPEGESVSLGRGRFRPISLGSAVWAVGCWPASTRMRRDLQTALMAGLAAGLLSTTLANRPAFAQSGIAPMTDESGRTIYVNNDGPATGGSPASEERSSRPRLMYWSSTEHRFKPVPTSGAVMRAARSAASEVNSYLDGQKQGDPAQAPSYQHLNVGFTQADINAAIDEAAKRHNVDPNLVRSVIKVESNFNPNAVSRKGAMGLMQLMPATARSLNVSNPFDPQQNVDAGVRHLRKLLDSYGGDVSLSLAAYNAGAGAVARSAGVPQFGETRNYVRRITQLYAGADGGTPIKFGSAYEPVRVMRDERGVLHLSNTE